MHLEIIRSKRLSGAHGTFGKMLIDGVHFCFTTEQPWNDNKHGESCVPEGDYKLLPYNSASHGETVVFHNPELNIYGTPQMIPHGIDGRTGSTHEAHGFSGKVRNTVSSSPCSGMSNRNPRSSAVARDDSGSPAGRGAPGR